MKAFSDSLAVAPPAGRDRPRGVARVGGAALVALCAGSALYVALPSSVFRARALVSASDIASPLSSVLSRAAADASVSEPVLLRAARSLIGTNVPVPAPDLVERVSVALGLGGAHPTGREARLAGDLAGTVTARPGDMPGSVEVVASVADAASAAQIATGVAEALIADQDETIAQARRKRDSDAITLDERLNAQAAAARRRLVSLGGVAADPTEIRAAAAAQTATAQGRVDTIHAIVASGSPPLSDRRDVPSGIETLQTTYLDLTRQLAKARETLGDRHTTIISLQNEVRHAAASLTAEWRRLAHLAETELSTARQREATLRRPDSAADAARRDAIEDARRNVAIADDNITRAQAERRETPIDERGYRLIARAPLPSVTSGLSALARAAIAGAFGVFCFWLGLRLPRLRDAAASLSFRRERRQEPIAPSTVDQPVDQPIALAEAADAALHRAMRRRENTMRDSLDPNIGQDADASLMRSMFELLPSLDSITPSFGGVPTIMVAANEAAADTTPAALALGRAAADVGYRVLVVEAARELADLAAAAEVDADPLVIDFFGVLRVALPAPETDGHLYLAPSFEHGARLASALARSIDTPLIEDIAAEFDVIIIDGGCAADSAAGDWGADAFVRVARFAAERDDRHFAATFGVAPSSMLGTIVAPTSVAQPRRMAVAPAAERNGSAIGAFKTVRAGATVPHAVGPGLRAAPKAPAPGPGTTGRLARAATRAARRRVEPRAGASIRH